MLKVVGIICRYILAALACWWFFWFLALIGQSAERSQELAGMAFGKAIICGAAASIWFYRARKAKQVRKLVDYSVEARRSAAPVHTDITPSPATAEQTPSILPPEPPQDSNTEVNEQPAQPDVPMPLAGKIFIAAVCAMFVGTIIVLAISNTNTDTPKTGQNQAPDSVDQKLSEIWAPNAKGSGVKSGDPNAKECPAALPSGVSSMPLNTADLLKIVGTDGKLTSEQSYDSLYAPNGTAWNATLSYSNKTTSCITMVTVELALSHAGSMSKERHSIVFQPLLGVGETQTLSVGLRIKTPERSEDVALLGWRTISASGFSSGSDAPIYDKNGFQIVKDPKDPFAAYGGHATAGR
jgi:hypothetical protein